MARTKKITNDAISEKDLKKRKFNEFLDKFAMKIAGNLRNAWKTNKNPVNAAVLWNKILFTAVT